MHLNRWVLLVSMLVGLPSIWLLHDAFNQYRGAARSFTQVEVEYVPGSFRWLDTEFGSGQLDLTIINRSAADVTIDQLNLRLYFDGEFAGARYAPWDAILIPQDTQQSLVQELIVSASGIQHQGGDAILTIRGDARLAFDGIARPLTVQVRETVGVVPDIE